MNRKRMNKKAVLDNASVLFWNKGFEKTSMRDIAYACGFHPGNIYNYFKSKEELLFEVLMSEMEHLCAKSRHVTGDTSITPKDQLRYFIYNHLYVTLNNPAPSMLYDGGIRLLSPTHREQYIKARDEYEGLLRDILRKGVDAGVFRTEDQKLVSFEVFAILFRTRFWYSPKGRLTIDQIVEFTWKFVLAALKDSSP